MIVGDKMEEDGLCDSEYMLNNIPKVAVMMREKFIGFQKGGNYI